MTTSTAEATPTQTAVRFLASDAAAYVTGQTIDADGGWATTAPSIFSRPVATNLTVGTVAYAAPEQSMGLEIDERAEQCGPGRQGISPDKVRRRISIRTRLQPPEEELRAI
jgi:NAD(P)-dependent dehydrogenase (short-subunit alcohol dehydrogenase family)